MKIRLTLVEEMLGTKPANKDVFADYVASKHPDGHPQKDELENAEHIEESGTTVFHRENGKIVIYDYQIKGFFKDAIGALNRFDKEFRGGIEKKLFAHKSRIDGGIFVTPRCISVALPKGTEVGICERPLRAETAQGPRVCLARSETVPCGSTLDLEISIFSSDLVDWVKLALDYGKHRGLGQWRNGGKGKFTWEQIS